MAQAKSGNRAKAKTGSASNSKPRSNAKPKSASGKTSASSRRSPSASSRSRASSSGGGGNASTQNGAGSKAPLVAGLVTGAAGLVGGAILATRKKTPTKVLGIPVPGTGGGIDGLTKQVGKAAKQFKKAGKQVGDLTDEVRAAREKAEQLGKAIS